MEIKLQSTITCPNCGHKKEETMPTDACQYFYECEKCKQVLKPKQGDCCVYCSYGSVACPPIQQDKKCCWQTKNKEAQPLTAVTVAQLPFFKISRRIGTKNIKFRPRLSTFKRGLFFSCSSKF